MKKVARGARIDLSQV